MTKLLITGAQGQVGRELLDRVRDGFDVIACDHTTLDITSSEAVQAAILKHHPDVVINAAAYTAVDKAEQDQATAMQVNRDGALHLAQACAQMNIPLIHISTDYVFDGQASRAYREDDTTAPLNVYGESKLQGEQAVRQHCPQHLIIRTSGVFSHYGNNFVKTMLRLAGERKTLRVVADQITCPTYAGDIADALLRIVQQGISHFGTFHYCSREPVSWYQFASAILQQQDVVIEPIASRDYVTPAKRPAYSVLNCQKIFETFNIQPHSWSEGLAEVIKRMEEKAC